METAIQTRIQLKIDTPENWEKIATTFIPLAGERIIFQNGDNSLSKTGDGTTPLADLNWDAGVAYDVPEWAKKDQLSYTDLPEQLTTELSSKLTGTGVTNLVVLTEDEYTAITSPSDTTLYIIKES